MKGRTCGQTNALVCGQQRALLPDRASKVAQTFVCVSAQNSILRLKKCTVCKYCVGSTIMIYLPSYADSKCV